MKRKLIFTMVLSVCIGLSSAMAAYVDNGDGTVTDTDTGLMWQQATPGTTYTWQGALDYCDGLDLAGHTDWRLPNRNELQSLVDYTRYNPVIDEAYFPGTSGWYRSSSSYADYPFDACFVDFYNGYVYGYDKSGDDHVRAVRAGQSRSLGHLIISNPVQGDLWDIGQILPISWEDRGIEGNAEISLSRDGGRPGSFSTLIASTPNDGSHNWTITGPSSVNCVLKIKPLNDPSKVTSQGLFAIVGTGAPVAVVSGTPPAFTNQTGAVLQVGGDTVISYRYRVDGGDYSDPTPISDTIVETGLPDGPVAVDVIGMDVRGNWQSTPTTVSWTVDTTPPSTGTIEITAVDGETTDATPELTLFSDGADAMRFALAEPELADAPWVSYATTYDAFDISAGGNGIKDVWVEYRDLPGNIQPVHGSAQVYYSGVPPFTLSPATVTIAEPAATTSFSMALGSAPTAPVSVSLSGCAGMVNMELPGEPPAVEFTPDVWEDITVELTAQDNYRVDGTRTCILATAPAVSGDTYFNGKDPDDLTVEIHDNDVAGIEVSQRVLTVGEPEDEASFTIHLKSEPASPVTIDLSAANTQATVQPLSVTLDVDNWADGEIVTVRAVDDSEVDGTRTCAIRTAPATSSDPNYMGLDPSDVMVRVQDDDTAAVIVSATSLAVDERDGMRGFTVRLSTMPTAPVTVSLRRENRQFTLTPTSMTFTADNWNVVQPVLVGAVADEAAEGTQHYEIRISAHSTDSNYHLPDAKTVKVTVNDAPSAGIQIVSLYPTLAKTGEETTFTVRGRGFGTDMDHPRVTKVSIRNETNMTETVATEFTVFDDETLRFTITTPNREGHYRLELYVDGVPEWMDEALTLKAVLPVYKAVVVLGKAGPHAPAWESTRKTAHNAYNTLLRTGFRKENIHYLSAEGNTDLDGDGEPDDWDGEATFDNVASAIEICAGGDPADQFVLYMIGDGYRGYFRLTETEELTATGLYILLNDELAPTVTGEIIILYDACYSGSFLLPLRDLPRRVVITSTDDDSLSYIEEGHDYSFSSMFWDKVRARYTVGPSFRYAAGETPDQTPQLKHSLGINVEELFIGRGGKIPMTDTPVPSGIQEPRTLPTGSLTGSVEIGSVTDTQGIETVWAVVESPCGGKREVTFTAQEDPGAAADGGEPYKGILDRLIFNGTYEITIHAEDVLGNLSESSEDWKTTLTKNDGIDCHEPDLTLDGIINLKDAILGLQVLSGAPYREDADEPYEDLEIDVGENGRIGPEEVVRTLQKVGG